jgi:hypothetical protein
MIEIFSDSGTYRENHARSHLAGESIIYVNNIWWLVEYSPYTMSCNDR